MVSKHVVEPGRVGQVFNGDSDFHIVPFSCVASCGLATARVAAAPAWVPLAQNHGVDITRTERVGTITGRCHLVGWMGAGRLSPGQDEDAADQVG